jgi:twinkle protein
MEDYSKYHIKVGSKTRGEVATLCPKCSHTRQKKNDPCLKVNLDKGCWKCWNCQWAGYLKEEKIEQKAYVKPIWRNKTDLSNGLVKWFESRKITQETLAKFRVTEGKEYLPQIKAEVNCIQFNYFNQLDELINIKFRDAKKNFKLVKDAKLIFYNLSNVNFKERVYICEGEIDCLTLSQSGFKNVLSVPNGASVGTNRLEWFDDVSEAIMSCPEVYLCLDNDIAGRKLREDLAERIGKDRCKYVEFVDCKDANDCLQKYDLQAIITSISEAKPFPLEGVFTISDMSDEIDDLYHNGLDSGVNLKIEGFTLNIVKGYLSIITGIPSHGKSEWVDNICVHLRRHHNWSGAFYSPENKPTRLHFSKIARKIIGKSWDGANRMSPLDVNAVKKYLDKKIWFIKPEKDFTLKSILDHAKRTKQMYGLDYFVIDAWNKLEHKNDGSTNAIGKDLDELATFCEVNNVHCFLVAHPTKMKKSNGVEFDVPTLYDINGSSNFYNKADNGICVFRDKINNLAYIYIQKVKFSHWGEESTCSYQYEPNSTRYYKGNPDMSNWISTDQVQTTLPANNEFLNGIVLTDKEPPF